MKNHIHKPLLYVALFIAASAASSALAQSEGVLVLTEDQQKLISQVQDRAADRRLKDQSESADGPLAKSREISATLNESLKAKDLEKAAAAWWAGTEAGVPKIYQEQRDSKLAEAREAARDAVDLIQATARRNARPAQPLAGEASGLAGEAASQVNGDMRAVEQEKQELDADMRSHVEQLSKVFPELRHVLQQSGLTSANVRELVVSRLREANQLVYQAGIAETNRLAWENMQRIIKARYVNGGNPQTLVTQSGSQVIKASAQDKVFK